MEKTLILFLLLFSLPLWAVKDGKYRLELATQHAKIPFHLEFKNAGKVANILNGDEVIDLKNLGSKKKNHISLEIPPYPIQLSLDFSGDKVSGFLIKANGDQIPVSGEISDFLFYRTKKRPENFQGRWEVTDGKGEKNILLLDQLGSQIKGSYLTPYGDYRYFHGQINGSTFEASSFDGVYNYLITGELSGGQLKAQILANYKIELKGHKNAQAKLPDPYKLTQMEKKLEFSFPDLSGKKVSISDKEFENKPVIIQIFGSWCPNCIDELKYLIPWYESNQSRGIKIIALSFERTNDFKRAQMILSKLSKQYGLNYPMLIAGFTAQDTPENKLKGLKNFKAFPTTIYLDKKHNVFKVHAGFNGPSTKEFFDEWQRDFNLTIDQLLK